MAEETDKERRLFHARQLVAAIEGDDEAAEAQALETLYGLHESALYSDLNRIAAELKKVLISVPIEGELSRIAQSELPDAQQRLQQVLDLTEAAADTSLTAVERALPVVKNVAAAAKRFAEGGSTAAPSLPGPTSLQQFLSMIVAEAEVVEKCLSDVLLAQGFQDITGQIIRRVAGLVAELESLLSRYSGGESGALEARAEQERLHRGTGPALPGRDEARTVRGQKDVDDLLGQLGI
jgi:chemotaxis protein CheZ